MKIIKVISPKLKNQGRTLDGRRASCVGVGGCDFPIRPDQNAIQATVHWLPEADTGTVILTAQMPISSSRTVSFPELNLDTMRRDPSGTSISHGEGLKAISLLFLKEAQPNKPLTVVVPLDEDGLDRIEALTRLWRVLYGRVQMPDTRLTAQRRRRFRIMLQAIDGHLAGATYREIANRIYGAPRVATDPWKTSALRDSVIGLVKDGNAMISGGYRQLLRHRRRS